MWNISPMLANIYLHYALDLWVTRRFEKSCTGRVLLIRYADDFVVCFQCAMEARRFREELDGRPGKLGLEVAAEKTKILEFGPLAAWKAKARGEKPRDFDFLCLTHYCSRTRNGARFQMKRTTSRKKLKAKVHASKEWLKASRTIPIAELMRKFALKLQVHYAYYGASNNSKRIARFYHECRKLLFKWQNRLGERGCVSWESFKKLLERFPLPIPRIMVNLFTVR